METERSWNC